MTERDEDRVVGSSSMPLDRLAHELRTPLAAIQSMAEALVGGHLGRIEDERHAGYVASIADTARHALAVVDSMLVARPALAPEPDPAALVVDVSAVARDVAASMAMLAARAGVRLALDATAPVLAAARGTDVRQMLINLVSNGLVHAGGGVTVGIGTGAAGGMAWIDVTDDGAGIPQGVVDRLEAGEPLDGAADAETAGRVRLGLTLTRALAAANGGRLELGATPAGTRARIVLPAAG
jgi:two-component system OmpR family sensor kinase